jgi:hypothetical protein
MIDRSQLGEADVSFRTLALLGGIALLAIHFYRLSKKVSRRRDGHQQASRPGEFPSLEADRPRPRVRAISSPSDEVPSR